MSIKEDTLVSHAWLTVILKDGVSVWVFEPDDFTMSATDSTLYTSPEVDTQAEGVLQVEFSLAPALGVLFSEGSAALPLSPNWCWSFEILHLLDDPVCPDCTSYAWFAVLDENHANESMFLLWRGGGP